MGSLIGETTSAASLYTAASGHRKTGQLLRDAVFSGASQISSAFFGLPALESCVWWSDLLWTFVYDFPAVRG